MPNSSAIRLVKPRRAQRLNQVFVERLMDVICSAGDDPKGKSEAALLLADELERSVDVGTIIWIMKRVAFSRLAEEDNDLMNAQIALLKGEF